MQKRLGRVCVVLKEGPKRELRYDLSLALLAPAFVLKLFRPCSELAQEASRGLRAILGQEFHGEGSKASRNRTKVRPELKGSLRRQHELLLSLFLVARILGHTWNRTILFEIYKENGERAVEIYISVRYGFNPLV